MNPLPKNTNLSNVNTYTSEYLYNRAKQMMKRKGYVVVRESRYGGKIEVLYGRKV